MKIDVGTRLIANWGAMYPVQEFTVIDIDGYFIVAQDDEGDVQQFHFNNIKQPGERSVNGSPIGVFIEQ